MLLLNQCLWLPVKKLYSKDYKNLPVLACCIFTHCTYDHIEVHPQSIFSPCLITVTGVKYTFLMKVKAWVKNSD